MYKYKVQVKKVSGRLNESVLPSKSLVVKSKTKKSKRTVLAEASKFFKKKYGLVIESADIHDEQSAKADMEFISNKKDDAMTGTIESRLTMRAWQDAIRYYSNYSAANHYLKRNSEGRLAEEAKKEVAQAGEKLKQIRTQLEQDLEKYEEEGILHLSTMEAWRKGYDI